MLWIVKYFSKYFHVMCYLIILPIKTHTLKYEKSHNGNTEKVITFFYTLEDILKKILSDMLSNLM